MQIAVEEPEEYLKRKARVGPFSMPFPGQIMIMGDGRRDRYRTLWE